MATVKLTSEDERLIALHNLDRAAFIAAREQEQGGDELHLLADRTLTPDDKALCAQHGLDTVDFLRQRLSETGTDFGTWQASARALLAAETAPRPAVRRAPSSTGVVTLSQGDGTCGLAGCPSKHGRPYEQCGAKPHRCPRCRSGAVTYQPMPAPR